MSTLVLASASPRRRDLLEQLGLSAFSVKPSDVDESVRPRELPSAYARRVSLDKALVQQAVHPDSFILSADTVVAVGRRILPKTEELTEAKRCLHLLSGRSHRVFGGVALITPQGRVVQRLVETRVTVKRLHTTEIDAYLASGEWQGKAGGYAIQGQFAGYIPSISGSYTNVVGLCLSTVRALLVGNGFAMNDDGAR